MRTMKGDKSMDINDYIADLFSILSHPLRIKIIRFIGKEGICVTSLCKKLNEGQPQVSRALIFLKQFGILTSKREGKKNCYRVNNEKIFKILDLAEGIIKDREKNLAQILKTGG